jgi:hypothetical protein
MFALAYLKDDSIIKIPVNIEKEANITVASIKKEDLQSGIHYIDFLPNHFTANAGDSGYFVSPRDAESGTVLTYFKERTDAEHISPYIYMACYGYSNGENAVLAIVRGMRCNCGLVERCKDNKYSLFARFFLDCDPAEEDIVVEFHHLDGNDYSAMAKCYRDYQLTVGGCTPLKDRVDQNPALKKSVDSIAVRIRMGWKPAPSPVLFQTPKNEPEMHVACSFKRAEEIAELSKKSGVENIEFCLVGWNQKGHDGRYPQIFPVEEKLGGEQGLKALIGKVKELDYLIGCHTNCTEAYTIADCFDDEYLVKDKDGSIIKHDPWSGGQPFKTCAKAVYERFEKANLPKISALGFNGLHYIDVITNVPLLKCYDKRHPTNRTQTAEYYRKIFKTTKQNFIGASSEGAFDFCINHLDFLVYTSFKLGEISDVLCDEQIPFFQLVYHGIVMYNPATYTLNYPVKSVDNRLKYFEYGGRPLAVFNAVFSTTRTWMGIEDLLCETDEQLSASVESLKTMYDDYQLLEAVRYCFMDSHKKISDGVFEIKYSNGVKIIVDYNSKTVKISNKPTLKLI